MMDLTLFNHSRILRYQIKKGLKPLSSFKWNHFGLNLVCLKLERLNSRYFNPPKWKNMNNGTQHQVLEIVPWCFRVATAKSGEREFLHSETKDYLNTTEKNSQSPTVSHLKYFHLHFVVMLKFGTRVSRNTQPYHRNARAQLLSDGLPSQMKCAIHLSMHLFGLNAIKLAKKICTAKKNLLNCLKLKCRKSQEASVSLCRMHVTVQNACHCAECMSLCRMHVTVQNACHCAECMSLCRMHVTVQNACHCAECMSLCRMHVTVQNARHCAECTSLCILHSDCAKTSRYANMWSLDGSLSGAFCMSKARKIIHNQVGHISKDGKVANIQVLHVRKIVSGVLDTIGSLQSTQLLITLNLQKRFLRSNKPACLFHKGDKFSMVFRVEIVSYNQRNVLKGIWLDKVHNEGFKDEGLKKCNLMLQSWKWLFARFKAKGEYKLKDRGESKRGVKHRRIGEMNDMIKGDEGLFLVGLRSTSRNWVEPKINKCPAQAKRGYCCSSQKRKRFTELIC
ncbi:uncharacterized protein VP01_201g2 [Puccinia sorghi]|uniref:Uncharacterized protein n=1 Tax=Puccinia sorghi TaxID=27349 RepID=A0A0L6VB73_9BASI|nr:uncharacterized protein VP01_201g2 [Puccinia sorghi]